MLNFKITKMKALILFFILFLKYVDGKSVMNDRPIIGIVMEELYNFSTAHNASNQIYASYVKYLESSGARVVPIWIHKPESYYEDLLGKINGVLFPGGGVDLGGTGYGRTGKIIFDLATKMNDKGDYFPLWGTCLGFELLNFMVSKKSWMKACAAEDLATNLKFVKGYNDSRIFKDLDLKLENVMKNENVLIHYHQWCFTLQNYSISGLDKYFKVLAVNKDHKDTTFISVVEAYDYPYYGVSFHPEKVVFEWVISKTHSNIPHNLEAIRVSQYFGNFFVDEARKNGHRFPSKKMEDEVLIYNYNPVFTGKVNNNPTEQKYYF